MLCKLLSLKANDGNIDREYLVREIYKTISEMYELLNNDTLLLIERFVSFYKKIPDKTFSNIKEEVNMPFVASTITEHIQYQSELKGKREGKIEGKREGKIEGKIEGEINTLQKFYRQKIINREQYERRIKPLKKKLDNFK